MARSEKTGAQVPAPADGQGVQASGKSRERTKFDIIEVATREFASMGFSGARVDQIAERTRTSKRMIYYYFGNKEGLYRAVLLAYYGRLRSAEAALDLKAKPPLAALQALVDFTFDYHQDNAEIVRLVLIENIHRGRNVEQLPLVDSVNSTVIDTVRDLCERGAAAGVMRPGIDPFELYVSIAALCFFNVSNRYTIRGIFGRDMALGLEAQARREAIWSMVRAYVTEGVPIPARPEASPAGG